MRVRRRCVLRVLQCLCNAHCTARNVYPFFLVARKSFNLDSGTLSVSGEDEPLSAFISVNFSGTRFRLSSFRLTVVAAEHNGKVLSCRCGSRQFILAARYFGSEHPLRLRHGLRLRPLSEFLFFFYYYCESSEARSFVLFATMTCALASAPIVNGQRGAGANEPPPTTAQWDGYLNH